MIFNDLKNRGLIKQTNNEVKLQQLLDEDQTVFYIGFDPTADSLHIGHLLQLVFAKRLIDKGHQAILLVGGATALIGDPTGKTDMRKMLSFEEIDNNIDKFNCQFSKIIGSGFKTVNNFSWFGIMNWLLTLRDIGPHFSVNNMLRADCFKSRMEGGLSFLEFNYMIMQAFDFFRLHTDINCQLQVGGDDQWSNMLAGINLIHKKSNKEAICLTLPLLTTSTGQKMGKTEKGAIWLDPNKTSVFDFFQFWRNLPDTDVIRCFKLLTFISIEEIENLPFSSVAEINTAKKKLAFEITKIVHGEDQATLVLNQVESLFEKQDVSQMKSHFISDSTSIIDLIVQAKFAKSKTEARNLINGKGISVNDITITDPTLSISEAQFGKEIVVRKGKKNFCKFIIEGKLNVET
jgi:tyrosyl-tRNA synthetase